MKAYKSERLKKIEAELVDLEQWLTLGLVPKKELTKHKQEIEDLKTKISDEKERIRFLKESGEYEEVPTPRRGHTRAGFSEMGTMPDADMGDTAYSGKESHYEMSTEQTEGETTFYEERNAEETVADKDEGTREEAEDEESYFSDRARWRRGGIQDPDADQW